VTHRGYFGVVFEGVVVFVDQFAAQFEGVFGGGLPKEGSQVVVEGTFPSALVVDEVRSSVFAEHDVAGLEVAIEEALAVLLGEVFGEESEVGLEFQLVEVEFGSFEKAIFSSA